MAVAPPKVLLLPPTPKTIDDSSDTTIMNTVFRDSSMMMEVGSQNGLMSRQQISVFLYFFISSYSLFHFLVALNLR